MGVARDWEMAREVGDAWFRKYRNKQVLHYCLVRDILRETVLQALIVVMGHFRIPKD
jgi:hypothetical protein